MTYYYIYKITCTAGENNPMYGKSAVKGLKCMNNGLQQKYVKIEEVNLYLQKGYSFGRLKKL